MIVVNALVRIWLGYQRCESLQCGERVERKFYFDWNIVMYQKPNKNFINLITSMLQLIKLNKVLLCRLCGLFIINFLQ